MTDFKEATKQTNDSDLMVRVIIDLMRDGQLRIRSERHSDVNDPITTTLLMGMLERTKATFQDKRHD